MDMRHIMFYFHSTQNIVMSLVTHVGFMPLTSKRFYQRKCHLLDTLVQRFHLHSCICGWLDWYSSQVAGSASTNPIDLSQIITVQLSTSIFTWPNPVFTRPNPVFTRPTTIFNRPSSSIHTAHSYARPTPIFARPTLIFWLSAYNCQADLIIICCIHLKAAHSWYHNDDDEVCVCVWVCVCVCAGENKGNYLIFTQCNKTAHLFIFICGNTTLPSKAFFRKKRYDNNVQMLIKSSALALAGAPQSLCLRNFCSRELKLYFWHKRYFEEQ